jgi:hypothetical protein
MFCILHISDLHRARTDPITNSELISALVSDRDRYLREDPAIPAPSAIVVSGDIIQGVGLDHPSPDEALKEQYAAALAFLDELCRRFVGGDRSRVIIVPGNHDIDWNCARAAMTPVAAADKPRDLPRALYETDSLYRWNWETQQIYIISDTDRYRMRLGTFWQFFETFYQGASGLLQVSAWSDANLFSLDEGRIGVAAFNSCVGNDCFAFHGAIPKDVVARAHLDLQEKGPWRLRVAVWHHNIEGPPYRSDYMDADIVRGMIGRGFRLGLYGHQHLPQVTPQHAQLPDRETMAVVSAGSLCAGTRELPTGARRGYSLVVVEDDYQHARVHVREMAVANLFSRAHLSAFGGRSFADLEWTTPVDAGGRPDDRDRDAPEIVIRAAERELMELKNPLAAVTLLRTSEAANSPFGRQLLLEAADVASDWALVEELTSNPQSIGELLLGIDAVLKRKDFDEAESRLNVHSGRLNFSGAALQDLQHRIRTLRQIAP